MSCWSRQAQASVLGVGGGSRTPAPAKSLCCQTALCFWPGSSPTSDVNTEGADRLGVMVTWNEPQ